MAAAAAAGIPGLSTIWNDVQALLGGATGNPNLTTQAVGNGVSNFLNLPAQWLASAAGTIASSLEAGFLAIIKDIWTVIVGPLEIIAGVLLAVIVLLWAMRDEVVSVAAMFAG